MSGELGAARLFILSSSVIITSTRVDGFLRFLSRQVMSCTASIQCLLTCRVRPFVGSCQICQSLILLLQPEVAIYLVPLLYFPSSPFSLLHIRSIPPAPSLPSGRHRLA